AEVADAHPSVGGEQLLVGARVVEVAETGRWTLAHRVPGRVGGGDVAAGVVEEADVHLDDQATGGLETVLAVVAHRGSAERAGLVRPVELQHPGTGDVLEAGRPLVRDRLAPPEHPSPPPQLIPLA